MYRAFFTFGVAYFLSAGALAAQESRLDVSMVTDEADAVLALLAARAEGGGATANEWRRVVVSQGYTRLKQREHSMGREFSDSAFHAFARSPELAEREADLRATLDAWARIDVRSAAARAFAYLPESARIRANVYPVIKPATNSFVFEPRADPAIFLYLDPQVSPEKLDNIVTHELHHIGVASVCPAEPTDEGLPENVSNALAWMGAFAEGRAVLAAAGGPDVHPHATSEAAERAVWDRDVAKVDEDLRRLERFFTDLLDGAFASDEEETRQGFTFISTPDVPQGAFYTVGWLMASVVEKELGRDVLVASLCDPRRFLSDYNRAARRRGTGDLPLWSDALLRRIGAEAPR